MVDDLDAAKKRSAEAEAKATEAEAKATKLSQQLATSYELTPVQETALRKSAGQLRQHLEPFYFIDHKTITWKKRVGAGTFGDCYKASIDERAGNVAVKRFAAARIDETAMRKVVSEILVLAAVSHPHIVRFLGCCLHPYVLLIMEFVDGGTLRGFIEANLERLENQMADESTDDSIVLTGTATEIEGSSPKQKSKKRRSYSKRMNRTMRNNKMDMDTFFLKIFSEVAGAMAFLHR